MRRLSLLVLSAAVLPLAGFAWAAEDAAPWSLRTLRVTAAVSQDSPAGEPAAKDAPDAAASRYLHITLAFDAAASDHRLHSFRITDADGKVLAEPYGYHEGQSRLVFESPRASLEGLYLDGLGRRVPLVRSAAKTVPRTAAADGPASKPQVDAPPPKPAGRGILDPDTPMPAEVEPPAKRPVLADPPPAKRPIMDPPPPPLPPIETPTVVPRSAAKTSPAKKPPVKKLYQELIVAHNSKFQVQGLDAATAFRYRVLSSLAISPPEPNVARRVEQTVESAKLLEGDAAAQGLITPLLNRLVGAKMSIDVDPQGRVVRLEGERIDQRAAAGPDLLGGQGFGGRGIGGQGLVLASLIDRDGWREISELSFFQPPTPLPKGRTWRREVAHSWGALGRWNGPAEFHAAGRKDGLDRVNYRMTLKHSPPQKAEGGALPFELANVSFKHEQAGGALLYDPKLRRVARAEEAFHVRGSMEAVVLGQRLPVSLDERQQFFVRIFESTDPDAEARDASSKR